MMQHFANFPGEIRLKGQVLNAPDGYVLSGTSELSVHVSGDASMSGDTEIFGDLVVAGALTNDGGWALTVHGDLLVEERFNFTPASTMTAQGNVSVAGNMSIGITSVSVGPLSGTVTSDDFSGNLGTDIDFAAGYVANNQLVVTMTSGDDSGNVASNCNFGSPDNFTLNKQYWLL